MLQNIGYVGYRDVHGGRALRRTKLCASASKQRPARI